MTLTQPVDNTAKLHEDAYHFLCRELIGEGLYRRVYECALRPDLVVKVEHNTRWLYRSFANVHEYETWEYWRNHSAVAKWLAPCEHISFDGRLMFQRRCSPLPLDYTMPDKMPAFLTDLKRANFGLLDGQLVCVDYAATVRKFDTKLKRVEW